MLQIMIWEKSNLNKATHIVWPKCEGDMLCCGKGRKQGFIERINSQPLLMPKADKSHHVQYTETLLKFHKDWVFFVFVFF